jgi:hypothetical protein
MGRGPLQVGTGPNCPTNLVHVSVQGPPSVNQSGLLVLITFLSPA